MSTVWNLNGPKQAEEALNYLYGLPDEEYNSDVEPDPEAVEEYISLDVGSRPSSSQNSIAANVDKHMNLLMKRLSLLHNRIWFLKKKSN